MIRTQKVKIGEIGNIKTGKTPPTNDNNNYGNDYMFIGPTDLHKHYIIDDSEKMISEKGLNSIKGSVLNGLSILVGCIGWDMGNVAIVNGTCATNQQINSITNINPSYNPYYIYYWLKNNKQLLFQLANVTRTPILNKTDFSNIEIEVPNKSRQDEVVKILTSIDSKIALNNRINAELEAMAKTVYDYWFVQFDFPFDFASASLSNNAQGKPSAEGKPYKSSGGKMVWCDELKREVPEGWEVKKIGEVATVKAGGDKPAVFSSDKTNECSIPIYSNGISNDGLYGYTNKAIINSQSVTISARGTIGFCFLRNKPYVPIIRLISLTPNLKGSAKYFYEAMTHFIFENSGSVQQQLTVPQVQNIKILYPNEDVLKMFDNITSPMIDRIEIIKEENQHLSSLRDWLLPMLMNGQVRPLAPPDKIGINGGG
jgi:type I restriction enzyme S subunit